MLTNLVAPANDLTHIMEQLFNHLPTSTMIAAALEKLASPLAEFFVRAGKRNNKLYTNQFLTKVFKKKTVLILLSPRQGAHTCPGCFGALGSWWNLSKQLREVILEFYKVRSLQFAS